MWGDSSGKHAGLPVCGEKVWNSVRGSTAGEGSPDEEESIEPSRNQQIELIEEMALPQSIRDALLENNNSEIYSVLGVDKFQDYVAGYIAGCITNGIGYIISFWLLFSSLKWFYMLWIFWPACRWSILSMRWAECCWVLCRRFFGSGFFHCDHSALQYFARADCHGTDR